MPTTKQKQKTFTTIQLTFPNSRQITNCLYLLFNNLIKEKRKKTQTMIDLNDVLIFLEKDLLI